MLGPKVPVPLVIVIFVLYWQSWDPFSTADVVAKPGKIGGNSDKRSAVGPAEGWARGRCA